MKPSPNGLLGSPVLLSEKPNPISFSVNPPKSNLKGLGWKEVEGKEDECGKVARDSVFLGVDWKECEVGRGGSKLENWFDGGVGDW